MCSECIIVTHQAVVGVEVETDEVGEEVVVIETDHALHSPPEGDTGVTETTRSLTDVWECSDSV